jgi:hypothetical protein
MTATARKQLLIGIGVVVIVIAIAVALYFAMRRPSGPPVSVANATPGTLISALTRKPPTTNATTEPDLRVGLYMSKLTGQQWGYSVQIVGELSRGDFDLVPILEPASDSVPEIKKLLGLWFKDKSPVSASDAEALKKLDVIVAPRIWLIPEASRAAIESAVRNGTGLLARNGVGCMQPGSGPDISHLNGFEESQFGYNPHPMDCEIIASHPILGKLAGQVGRSIQITPNGTWGIPNAQTTPLIRVKDMNAFRAFYQLQNDWTFYPLYVSQLGKGRIVGCQFPAWSPTPKDLMSATDQEFNIRAVKWLAHRLDETTPTTARASTSPAR